jgi:hypothetical protein
MDVEENDIAFVGDEECWALLVNPSAHLPTPAQLGLLQQLGQKLHTAGLWTFWIAPEERLVITIDPEGVLHAEFCAWIRVEAPEFSDDMVGWHETKTVWLRITPDGAMTGAGNNNGVPLRAARVNTLDQIVLVLGWIAEDKE